MQWSEFEIFFEKQLPLPCLALNVKKTRSAAKVFENKAAPLCDDRLK
jgi:hypothetical protein